MSLAQFLQKDDWKKEKHIPVIEIEGAVEKGKPVSIHLSVGKGIPHPNTTEHHIRWFKLFFHANGEKYPYHVGTYQFEAHAESFEGANKGPVKSEPDVRIAVLLEKPGKLLAMSYCNIHGLWESSLELEI